MNLKTRLIKNLFGKKNLLNKYSLSIMAFIVWIGFFDRYSLINQFKLTNKISALEKAKVDYEFQLQDALSERKHLNNDIEKYAREKYLFHKDNEKVILVR